MCNLCEIEDHKPPAGFSRRQLLRAGLAAGTLLAAPVTIAGTTVRAPAPGPAARTLRFSHNHTGERLTVTYAENGRYLSDALKEISRFLRDFRTGEIHPIDPGVLDILHRLRQQTGGGTYRIVSAFRSPRTNEMLRQRGGGVATRSLHMDGRAIDVQLAGVPTRSLREAALALKAGGVGYYPKSDFLHVDTGRVRFW